MKSHMHITALTIVAMLCGLTAAAQSQGTWLSTGAMSTGRYAITAVTLPSGKILVGGGVDGYNHVLASAELYDPGTGTWSATGNMNTARNNYLAVLLPNGKVLVAGGCTTSSCSAATPTAEIYDPFTGRWSTTGAMSSIHYFTTATLLPNGKVLVGAGCSLGNCNAVTTTAELYDPATGRWSLTGSMAMARSSHAATLLSTGKVLVNGGYTYSGATNSSELYDPATGRWSAAASSIVAHTMHSATSLQNGKVLLAGGRVVMPSNYCELYDPVRNTWAATGAMITKREGHPAVLLPNGKVLVSGGESFSRPYWYAVSAAELYDPARGTWSSAGAMSTARYEQGLVLMQSGRVLAVGGLSNSSSALPTAEVYVP